ncbi:7d448a1b-1fe2-4f6d-ba15-5cf29b313e52 [Sclerotinia trifoliorum]|uniref:7d448a1b-1fe2-4f6d-ba15-5cf29b313e52 n=1 Tax=Sclerotinia trifoliorum TaxID=28548 RepID=A0A8H2VM73_9HELO|nr:7d448a1b-1fe2-4f6d-ba15-5cf29b313e52 [Sclerotinia trifoliorum]
MCIYTLTHHTCPHTSLLLQEKCSESLRRRKSVGGGNYESPPCKFDRGRFERWKREGESSEQMVEKEKRIGRGKDMRTPEREVEDKNDVEDERKRGRSKMGIQTEFRENWAEGMCVNCKAEREGNMVLARKTSFTKLVRNLLSIDRELQMQRLLSVQSANGRQNLGVSPVSVVGRRRERAR